MRRIKSLREDKDLSCEFISKHLGITLTAYSKIENNIRNISAKELLMLVSFYKKDPFYIMGFVRKSTFTFNISIHEFKNNKLNRLKKLRKDNNYSQKEIADYLQIHLTAYSKAENGSRKITSKELLLLILLYECDPFYIMGYTKKKMLYQKEYIENITTVSNDIRIS